MTVMTSGSELRMKVRVDVSVMEWQVSGAGRPRGRCVTLSCGSGRRREHERTERGRTEEMRGKAEVRVMYAIYAG